jgi:hypothetical protein
VPPLDSPLCVPIPVVRTGISKVQIALRWIAWKVAFLSGLTSNALPFRSSTEAQKFTTPMHNHGLTLKKYILRLALFVGILRDPAWYSVPAGLRTARCATRAIELVAVSKQPLKW